MSRSHHLDMFAWGHNLMRKSMDFRKPTATIVIPCYNAAPLIESCIENVRQVAEVCRPASIVEVIFVDDGSDDGSYDQLRAHRAEAGLKVLRLDVNSGPGVARNYGLAFARGCFVAFQDIDDRIDPDAFKELLCFAGGTDADLISYDATITDLNGSARQRKDLSAVAAPREQRIRSFLRAEMDGSVIFTLFRRRFLAEHHLFFPPGLHEDIPFIFRAYYHARRIAVFPQRIYRKYSRPTSIIHTIGKAHVDGILAAYLAVVRFLEAEGVELMGWGDDIRYGFTGFVADLILKLVRSEHDVDAKHCLCLYLLERVKQHQWLFFRRFDSRTRKDRMVLLFKQCFMDRPNRPTVADYAAFERTFVEEFLE